MKAVRSRKKEENCSEWPKKVRFGRITVSVYRRWTPGGKTAFMVANYAEGKRRFDCYATESEALLEAVKLAKRLSKQDVLSASMTREQSVEFASAVQSLTPLNLTLLPAIAALVEAVKLVGDLPSVVSAAKFYAARRKCIVSKPVKDVVAELIAIKKSRGASGRYIQDLRYRLNRFADAFCCNASSVTTAEIQEWLDIQKLSTQGYTNFRRVLHLLFAFAVTRAYASDNPVAAIENVKVRNGDIEIYTPSEISRLLAAAPEKFLPCLAIGAFAGLRSAEIERLDWSDVRLAERLIVVSASKSKTAGRRIVPIPDNLYDWLEPLAQGCRGKIWQGTHREFYIVQQKTAAGTQIDADLETGINAEPAVPWKTNALRHSYASYRFAQTADAGRVAGELGNSAAVVHRHYRELVKPKDADEWFNVRPGSQPRC